VNSKSDDEYYGGGCVLSVMAMLIGGGLSLGFGLMFLSFFPAVGVCIISSILSGIFSMLFYITFVKK